MKGHKTLTLVASHAYQSLLSHSFQFWCASGEGARGYTWGRKMGQGFHLGSHHPCWVQTFHCGYFKVSYGPAHKCSHCSVSKSNKLIGSSR